MENKLQELTQKLYEEGLSKGRSEAENLVAEARAQAKRIISDAEAEAQRILREANASSEELHKNTLTELNLAGKQAISDLKASIQDMVVARSIDKPVGDAAMDPQFVKEILLAIARNWKGDASEAISLRAILPESLRGKLDANFTDSVKESLSEGLDIEFREDLRSGFRIGPRDGGYYISFTDDSFKALLDEYLRPKVNEILYGTQQG